MVLIHRRGTTINQLNFGHNNTYLSLAFLSSNFLDFFSMGNIWNNKHKTSLNIKGIPLFKINDLVLLPKKKKNSMQIVQLRNVYLILILISTVITVCLFTFTREFILWLREKRCNSSFQLRNITMQTLNKWCWKCNNQRRTKEQHKKLISIKKSH